MQTIALVNQKEGKSTTAVNLGIGLARQGKRVLLVDAAVLVMVDSNLQRENILPSEQAFAYRMKLEALKHQGKRSDLTSAQIVPKLQARDIVANEAGVNRMEVTRYIRLTHLIPDILKMVDNKSSSVRTVSSFKKVSNIPARV